MEEGRLKRFLLFAFEQYYPEGGWHDFRGSFKHISEARDFFLKHCTEEFYQIVDSKTGEIVDEGSREFLKAIREKPGEHPFKEETISRRPYPETGKIFVRHIPKTESPEVIRARAEFAERMRKKRKGEVSDVFIYALPLVLLGIIALKRIFS